MNLLVHCYININITVYTVCNKAFTGILTIWFKFFNIWISTYIQRIIFRSQKNKKNKKRTEQNKRKRNIHLLTLHFNNSLFLTFWQISSVLLTNIFRISPGTNLPNYIGVCFETLSSKMNYFGRFKLENTINVYHKKECFQSSLNGYAVYKNTLGPPSHHNITINLLNLISKIFEFISNNSKFL